MGYTLDSGGKPVFSASPTQTVVDLQAAVDFAKKYAFGRAGTSGDRTGLPPGELWDGLMFYETNTNSVYRYDGGWLLWERDWTNYTPTISGLTLNGALPIAKYKVERGLVTVKIRIAVGTLSTTPVISLPISAADAFRELLVGRVIYTPNAGSEGIGEVLKTSATQVSLMTAITAAGTIYLSGLSSTLPITFGTNTSTIAVTFEYEVA